MKDSDSELWLWKWVMAVRNGLWTWKRAVGMEIGVVGRQFRGGSGRRQGEDTSQGKRRREGGQTGRPGNA